MARTASKHPARDVYQEVTDKIVAQLEAGVRPWVKPWQAAKVEGCTGIPLPRRVTGEFYRGVNVFLLWIDAATKGYSNTTWMTFKQAQELGGCVRKGETGSFICYASKFTKTEQNAKGEEVTKAIPFMKGYTVFNVEQIDGLPERFTHPEAVPVTEATEAARIATVEAFYASLGLTLSHGGDRAFYAPAFDRVQMPHFHSFADPARYYDTLGHETVHWTGHKTRLDRNLKGRNGNADYAREEMVAELGAAFLAAHLGISSEPRADHASYLASWLQVLKDDKRAIFQASSAAQKAVDYLQGLAGKAATEEPEALAEAA